MPTQNSSAEWSALVRRLTAADAAVRAGAARDIFERGRTLARAAIKTWLADESLACLFIKDASGFPETTVGLAVEPATFERISKAFASPDLAEVPPDQDAKEFELELPGGVRLDILTSREPEGSGAIARHLQKFGESIQQVELSVKNVEQATQILRSHFQLTPVFPETRAGANGTRVNFFLIPAIEGKKVLIELVEAGWPA
jgi:hypothetical protein